MLSLCEFKKQYKSINRGRYGEIYKYKSDQVVKWSTCEVDNCRCPAIRTELNVFNSIEEKYKSYFVEINAYSSGCPMAYSMKYMPLSLFDIIVKEHFVSSDLRELSYFTLMMSSEEELDRIAESKNITFNPPSDHRIRLSKVYQLLLLEMDNETVQEYVKDHPNISFDEVLMDNSQLDLMFEQLFEQLSVMQELKIIHRDINHENILLDSNYKPYIIDFGCALRFDSTGQRVIAGALGRYPTLEDQYNTWHDCARILYVFYLLFDHKYSEILFKRYYQVDIIEPEQTHKNPVISIDANKVVSDYRELRAIDD